MLIIASSKDLKNQLHSINGITKPKNKNQSQLTRHFIFTVRYHSAAIKLSTISSIHNTFISINIYFLKCFQLLVPQKSPKILFQKKLFGNFWGSPFINKNNEFLQAISFNFSNRSTHFLNAIYMEPNCDFLMQCHDDGGSNSNQFDNRNLFLICYTLYDDWSFLFDRQKV